MPHPPPGPVAPPPALAAVVGPVEQRLSELLDAERRRWSEFDPVLAEPFGALSALVLDGGKRLRPAFCHWGHRAAGGVPDDDRAVDAGVALELLHAFALVHDDVMDGSAVRRGSRTAHLAFADRHDRAGHRGEARRFGEGMAILIGDLLHALADHALGDVAPEARLVWDELRIEVDVGQLLDLMATASGITDDATARRIARCKSGRYTVERPLHLGAALAGGLGAWQAPLSAYGAPLGEAFQLRDDLLGVFGDSARTGKPVGDDLREGKATSLLAEATARAGPAERTLLRRVGGDDLTPSDVADLQAVLVATGARAHVESEVTRLRDEAIEAIRSACADREVTAALVELAEFVAGRDA